MFHPALRGISTKKSIMPSALKWSDLDLLQELGSGQAGIVSLARLRQPRLGMSEGEYVAVKQFKSWVLEQPGQLERVYREVETGRRIIHPNLVLMHGVILDDHGR